MFEFVMQYNHRDFLYLNKLTARTYRKWYNLFYRLFTAVFGAFFTASGIFLLSGGGSIVSCIFIMVIGMTLLLVSAFTSRISAWRSKRLSVQNLGQITFTFTDEQISYVCAKESAQLPYSSILSFFRYHERYFLFLDPIHAYVLPYSDLKIGNRDEFELFLTGKTGKEWDKVYHEPKKKKIPGEKTSR